MATTVGSFSAIDDTEVDAESPITETLMTRMRDNSYWIDAGTRQTTETDTSKVLKPDGSGGVQWGVGGVDGTKGAGNLGTSSGSPTQISILSSRLLRLECTEDTVIDSADDTYARRGATGTITGSFATIDAGGLVFARKNGGNYEFYAAAGYTFAYVWL